MRYIAEKKDLEILKKKWCREAIEAISKISLETLQGMVDFQDTVNITIKVDIKKSWPQK